MMRSFHSSTGLSSATEAVSGEMSSSSQKAKLSNVLAFQPVGEDTPCGSHVDLADMTSREEISGTRAGNHRSQLACTQPSVAFVTMITLAPKSMALDKQNQTCRANSPRCSTISGEGSVSPRPSIAVVGHRVSSQSKMKRMPGSYERSELHDKPSQPRSFNHGSQPEEGVDGSDPEKLSSLHDCGQESAVLRLSLLVSSTSVLARDRPGGGSSSSVARIQSS
mmetsp:Transcript_43680/g.79703  ORF Transcript_43680/g.79703 Transcript_43680/m.79703 type:complete len:222 (+) Transcript_43680:274-939(+)